MHIRLARPKLQLHLYIDGDIDGDYFQLVDCSHQSINPTLAVAKCFSSIHCNACNACNTTIPGSLPPLPPLPPSHSSKDTAGCIEQVLSHLCTTLLLYLISLLSTPLADFLLIDQPAASSSSLANRVCHLIRSFFYFYCQMVKYINLVGGLPSRHLLFSRCVFLLIPLRYPDLSDTSHVIHARSGFENRIRLSGDRVRY